MIEKTLAKRYAAALLSATRDSVEDTEATLLSLKTVYERDARLRDLLGSPKVTRASKKALLRRMLAGAAKPVHAFFDLLVTKHRTNLIPGVADVYDHLADAIRGVVRIEVHSAYPLKAAQETALKSELERATGSRVSIEKRVDPSLKGGLLVYRGWSGLDGSLKTRLKNLRERLELVQKR